MRILSKMAVLAAVAMFAGACCPCRSYQKKTRRPLTGTEWQLVQLNGQDIPNPDSRFSLHFENRRQLNGSSGCNRYRAACDAQPNGHLHIGEIAVTRMACPDAGTESSFLEMLRSTVRYELDAKMLILSDSIGVRAIFQAAGTENKQL